ncbi:MAG TPA: OmpA family protein [Chitinispirillaceae bacterium]|nr:OmpA family protein [Chitinispirillaceae bacterium]
MIHHIKIVISLITIYSSAFSLINPVLNESGQVGLKQVISAQTLGVSHLALFFNFDFSSSNTQVHRLIEPKDNEPGYDTTTPKLTLCSINPAIAYGITDFLDAAVHIPFAFDIMENFAPEAGFGDLEFDLKFRIPVKNENLFQSGLYASLSLPTGNQTNGTIPRHFWNVNKSKSDTSEAAYDIIGTYTNKKPEFSSLLLLSLCSEHVKLHGNGGVILTLDKDADELLLLGCGLEYCPSRSITLFADIKTMTSFMHIRDGFRINADYLRLSPGILLRSNSGMSFTFSGDFDLSSRQTKFLYDINDKNRKYEAVNSPVWGVSVQIGWNDFLKRPDRDGDLINDPDDKCPDQKEDFDQFEDADGCPDLDNDGDGIPDIRDSCRDVAEDMDGVMDSDGCPDFDNDKDNVPDSVDNCPQSEDFDGYQDNDGCPDYDNDVDGVADSLDRCPMIPEDRDNFEDSDGCPDLDNDMDGVADSIDNCPLAAGNPKLNGCPGEVPEPKEIKFGRVILKGVDFGSGSSVMSEGSKEVLDQVVASMNEWSEMRLEIRAHTDNSGDPDANIELCQKRAEVICNYLIEKGVASTRLVPAGMGGTDPIADNNTVTGRKINTRVEIHRKN